MPTRHFRQEESWSSLHHSEASGEVSDDFAYPEDASMDNEESNDEGGQSATESPHLPTVRDVQRALHPLQATADRVGKQVEQFAENLDRFARKRPQNETKSPKDCRHVLPFVHAYKRIARNTVKHLQTMHAPERQRQLVKQTRKRMRKSNARSTSRHDSLRGRDAEEQNLTTVADLKRWEQEEQTWDLLGSILQLEYPVPESERSSLEDLSSVRPRKETDLHKLSSEKEVWDSLLASDDLAWERYIVLEWLKRTADQSGPEIEHVVEQLESDADRGSGIVAHSWLYTREAVKGQKRFRSWPQAFEPDDPGLENSLLSADKSAPLVTQLDPDAITRQSRTLEKPDVYFERAIWLACWEMVRRGRPWTYIKDWCNERVEDWRASIMLGDLRLASNNSPDRISWQSHFLWRKTCAIAAKDSGIDEYEKAVYGVLSGHLPSVQQISRSWDDHVFAHYNAYLIHSFERYIKHNFGDRIPSGLSNTNGVFHFSTFAGQRALSGNQLVEKLKLSEDTKQESLEPFKMLQGSLVAKNFGDYVVKHGLRLSENANAQQRSKILTPIPNDLFEGSLTAPINMQDYDLLRVITHVILVYKEMGYNFGDRVRTFAMENIIVAYIDYLGKAGKQQLLPVYASHLSRQRCIECLGRQLPAIQQHDERVTMINLMKQSGIDVSGVLFMQLQMIFRDTPPDPNFLDDYPNLQILEPLEKSEGQVRPVAGGFIGHEITDDQVDLIHAFEWYMLLDGFWQQTMLVGAAIYKHLLRSQALAAAKLLSQTVPFSNISLSKSYTLLGKTTDISRSPESDDEPDGPASPVKKPRPRGRPKHQPQTSEPTSSVNSDEKEILLGQAKTFRDLENLFVALNAMEEWRDLAIQISQVSK